MRIRGTAILVAMAVWPCVMTTAGAVTQDLSRQPPAVQPFVQSSGGTVVTVHPVRPDTGAAPTSASQAIKRLAAALAQPVAALAAQQDNLATCFEGAKAAPPDRAEISSFSCEAEAAGATRAAWTTVGSLFRNFDSDLAKVDQRIGATRQSILALARRKDEEVASIGGSIETGLVRVRQIRAALQNGRTLTPDQEDAARQLIDDLRTMKAKAAVVTHSRASVTRTLTLLDGYAGRIAEARRSATLLAHQAANKSDLWGSILEDLQARASIVGLGDQMGTLDVADLGAQTAKLKGFSDMTIPALPDPGSSNPDVKGAPPILPRGSLSDDLDALLSDQTAK